MHIFAQKLVSRTSKQFSKSWGHYGNRGLIMILNLVPLRLSPSSKAKETLKSGRSLELGSLRKDPLHMSKDGSIWQLFVLCLLALRDTVPKCYFLL